MTHYLKAAMQEQQNHEINVIYQAGQPQATWTPRPQGTDRIQANVNDTISFVFDGPETLTNAVMMSGPRKKGEDGSPFDGGNQINIVPGTPYTIDKNAGLWGFSIAFTTVNADGVSNFYFLPDPELEVGST
ncbi:hypothetical protein [Massilia sp. H6]|uniref:hypothetical protein n=1 Tax=Massilia sp. H6 TaxID=2970464 RepID=UPI002167D168|nr:hypothetical protein [Massilia sp. H6]UVW27241.1 hypothetical protein NRS07_11760 [Massilia sp. H6]